MIFNPLIETAVIANVLAQLMKIPIYRLRKGEWKPGLAVSTGGMPSSHSATVASLATITGLIEGIHGTHFAITFVLAGVVIYDAMGIRRHAGKHAAMLNKLIADLKNVKTPSMMKKFTHPGYQKEFKELLGHEPAETFWGTIFGITVGFVYYYLAFVKV